MQAAIVSAAKRLEVKIGGKKIHSSGGGTALFYGKPKGAKQIILVGISPTNK